MCSKYSGKRGAASICEDEEEDGRLTKRSKQTDEDFKHSSTASTMSKVGMPINHVCCIHSKIFEITIRFS